MQAARDVLITELRGGIARHKMRPCDPEQVIDLALTLVNNALMQHALGIAHSEHVGKKLARRVLEPLHVQHQSGARQKHNRV